MAALRADSDEIDDQDGGMAIPQTDLTTHVPRPTPRSTRIGDRERANTCDELSAHFAAGRMTSEELDERLAAAVGARTEAELRWVLADLPPLDQERPRSDPPLAPPQQSPSTAWSAWDVIVLLVLLGCVAVAGLAAVALVVAGIGGFAYIVATFLSALVAGTGGAAAVHLAHRSHHRHREGAASAVNPR